jgi:hypothetical protein
MPAIIGLRFRRRRAPFRVLVQFTTSAFSPILEFTAVSCLLGSVVEPSSYSWSELEAPRSDYRLPVLLKLVRMRSEGAHQIRHGTSLMRSRRETAPVARTRLLWANMVVDFRYFILVVHISSLRMAHG